ncbi:Expressed protein precursor [hydrothermal vent metagenome]|uniref:Expressed protein n=1 Tax=hydrothermal vent metagenome TaxID=652676 RepID=A0A3B0ZI96_9ZZZZ
MIAKRKEKLGIALIAVLALLVVAGILLQNPVAQDLNYHLFKDARTLFYIPNFWNVLSNILFLLVGLLGLYRTLIIKTLNIKKEIKASYILLFAGITLVAFGSGYYHLWPDNQTLVWDRLPMTIAFMALFSIIISEYISVRIGKALLLPFIILGMASVLYWYFSELNGMGDLRYYAIVQFFPMLAMPIIFIFFNSQYSNTRVYWLLLVVYIAAKVFEHFDEEIYNTLGIISGHSLKHIVVALGLYILLISYTKRTAK